MEWETIWIKIKEFVISFYNFAMNEGENKFMLVDMNLLYGRNISNEMRNFFFGSFVIMVIFAILACDSFRFFHPINDIREWKSKISIVKVIFFAAAVFSFHTFYKMLITITGGVLGSQASIDALACLGTYINPISVMIYAYAISTMTFRKRNIQALFLGWTIFLTPAVMSYSTFTREHIMLYIVAASFGIAGALLYRRYSPYLCYFFLSVVYFICKLFMIYYSEEILLLTSENWPGKIGQYLACVQMDIILTFLLLMILLGYKEITIAKEELNIKKDIVFSCITACFMVCAIVSNQVVEVNAIQLEKEEPNYYIQREPVEEAPIESEDEGTEDIEIALDNEPIITFVITVDTANIRYGPGTDYDVIMTAARGEGFSGTGAEEMADNGRVWYEIYINNENCQTGWASSVVIEKQETLPVNKLVGDWHGTYGSILTLEENGICYYKDGYAGEGEGTWEVDGQAILHVYSETLSYEIYAVLGEGYDTTSMTVQADSSSWRDEVFSKQ